jgi:predicted enzyme related to lactoylglutathione lyase
MSQEHTIDYIELPAANIGAAKAFYTSVFGWAFEDYGADYTAFSDGRLNGGFMRSEQHCDSEAGGALVVLYAADLEATRARIVEHGGAIKKEIFSFPGGRRFHFADPNGNELAVWSDKGE